MGMSIESKVLFTILFIMLAVSFTGFATIDNKIAQAILKRMIYALNMLLVGWAIYCIW